MPLLEGRIDGNDESEVFSEEYSCFEVSTYFVGNSAPSLKLASKGSKFLSPQNWNPLLRCGEFCLVIPSVQ